MFPGLDPYYTADPAQYLKAAGQGLDVLDRDLSDLSILHDLDRYLSDLSVRQSDVGLDVAFLCSFLPIQHVLPFLLFLSTKYACVCFFSLKLFGSTHRHPARPLTCADSWVGLLFHLLFIYFRVGTRWPINYETEKCIACRTYWVRKEHTHTPGSSPGGVGCVIN